MKCTVDQKELLSALKIMLNVIPKKTYLPTLTTVLLETSGESSLILSATNLETSIRSTIVARFTQKGAICIPARHLFEIIKSLPKSVNQIELELTNTLDFVIRAGDGIYKILGIAADEFPTLPVVDFAKIETIPADIFCDMVRKVEYAVSNDECRPSSLCGVLWQTSGKQAVIVAINGHELVEVISKKIQFATPHVDVIIPLRPLTILGKLLTKEITEIGVIFEDNNLIFVYGNTTILTRLIEGPYLDYKKVVSKSKNNDQIVIINKESLLQALQQLRVSIVDDRNYRTTLMVTKNQLKLSTKGVTLERPCQFEGKKKIEVAYNINYLINTVEHIDGNEVKFAFKESPNSRAPLRITPTNKNDGHLCLVMPLLENN